MPEFEKSKGFKMKGPTFFKSALKKYGKSPAKHKIRTSDGDLRGHSKWMEVDGKQHRHPVNLRTTARGEYYSKPSMLTTEERENKYKLQSKKQAEESTKRRKKTKHKPNIKGKNVKTKHHEGATSGVAQESNYSWEDASPEYKKIKLEDFKMSGKKSPNKFLGKLKDKIGGGAKGAGLGMLLGGPIGALAGGLIGKRREKKKAAEGVADPTAAVPMMKKGNKNYKEKDIKRGKHKGGKKEIYKTRDAHSGKKRKIVAISNKEGDVVKIKGGPKAKKKK